MKPKVGEVWAARACWDSEDYLFYVLDEYCGYMICVCLFESEKAERGSPFELGEFSCPVALHRFTRRIKEAE
jgi:hypothetical protein